LKRCQEPFQGKKAETVPDTVFTPIIDDSADTVSRSVTTDTSAYGVSLHGLQPGGIYFRGFKPDKVTVKQGPGGIAAIDAFFAELGK
jgi:hypothetical protein